LIAAILGLGFGDCGKGLFVDALCRRWGAHTVVRFNGGAQAGHNVVLPDGRHHTFSQVGSGAFVGAATVLASPVVVHPSALAVEVERLEALGVDPTVLVDARCRVNTPFHQAAGRLRERRLGHGTCGVGVGETVRHELEHPENVLRYGDLVHPALTMQKLDAIRRDLEAVADPAQPDEATVLTDPGVSERWLLRVTPLLRRFPPASPARVAERLNRPGTVIFEGAQGALLDEDAGFHPHTTWSRVRFDVADAIATEAGVGGDVLHLGVLRTCATRHGPGPFPTWDPALDVLPEPHNAGDGWQGPFRRGHPDAVLLRYARSFVGRLDGLLVSHLDDVDRVELRWCEAWDRDDPFTAVPRHAPGRLGRADVLERYAETLGCPVRYTSVGPTWEDVREAGDPDTPRA